MDLIFYHNNCPDGWAAAYIAKLRYPEATLRPADHGTPPPFDEVIGKDVLMVDFAWKTRETNIKLNGLAKSLRILDHHKTAQADLDGLSFTTFDVKRSGAGLAWDYLFGKDSNWTERGHTIEALHEGHPLPSNVQRPWWVDYIEDQDLWRWSHPHSHAVGAYLKTVPHTIEAWHKLGGMLADEAVKVGLSVNLGTDYYVREMVKMRKLGTFRGFSVGAVNAPYVNCSELGAELALESEIGICYYERADGKMTFSLRSSATKGNVDVSAVAKEYGGGGHHNAGGFELGLKEGRNLIDMILGRHWTQLELKLMEETIRAKGGCVK